MIYLKLEKDFVVLTDGNKSLTNSQKSTLQFWEFSRVNDTTFSRSIPQIGTLQKIHKYLIDENLTPRVDDQIESLLFRAQRDKQDLQDAIKIGNSTKTGSGITPQAAEFLNFTRKHLPRRLMPHQEKAAIHLLNVRNAANFSVPGAGKSAVILAVYSFLRYKKKIKCLFVVGPRSCFEPWHHEYQQTLGIEPDVQMLAGGNLTERKLNYYVETTCLADLYLTTFQTLTRDIKHVECLFRYAQGNLFLVIDEAHYIKRSEGAWANTVLRIARLASQRTVLSGTPFPHSYADAISIFDVLYPNCPIFNESERRRLRQFSNSGEHSKARQILESRIFPFFYRVRKNDLGLTEPQFIEPITVVMKPIERQLYDLVIKRIRSLSKYDNDRDSSIILKLRRARVTRMRQSLSFSALLSSVFEDANDQFFGETDSQLEKLITSYESLETPGKIDALLQEIYDLRQTGQKVVIWSNFIRSLSLIVNKCRTLGWNAKMICGTTPTMTKKQEIQEEETRAEIIEEFKRSDSQLDILVANPAACAESISLHTTCSNAIYYDLSYNCAQYLQSLDRIHRVGGSEDKLSYYRFLQYGDTLEPLILKSLLEKFERMALVVDEEFPLCDIVLDDLALEVYHEITK